MNWYVWLFGFACGVIVSFLAVFFGYLAGGA